LWGEFFRSGSWSEDGAATEFWQNSLASDPLSPDEAERVAAELRRHDTSRSPEHVQLGLQGTDLGAGIRLVSLTP